MEHISNFFNQPIPTVIFTSVLILIFSAFLRISIITSILVYGLGLSNFVGKFCALALSVSISFFIIQSDLDKSFKFANFTQNNNSAESLQKLSDAWKNVISSKVPEEMKSKFIEIAKSKSSENETIQADSWKILAPAYVIFEIKNALSIGFKILLPFILIDLLCAYFITAIGITSLSSETISLPLKLLAFISVNGLELISENLARLI